MEESKGTVARWEKIHEQLHYRANTEADTTGQVMYVLAVLSSPLMVSEVLRAEHLKECAK